MKYGDRIAALREQLELTQEELAEKIGISRAALSHYEKNRRQPDYELVKKFADFFGVTTDYLLGRTDIRTPQHPAEDEEDIVAFLRAAEGLTESERKEVLAYIEFRKAQRRQGKK